MPLTLISFDVPRPRSADATALELLGKVDAVSVVVPTKLHREVATFFLEHGVDVLVEKPIARTSADGQALVELAAKHGRVLQVGHVERFNPALRGIAALVPRRVVYVSCDAMTLGRDLVELAALGLRARRVQPIDLMPQTAEIECVAEIERA